MNSEIKKIKIKRSRVDEWRISFNGVKNKYTEISYVTLSTTCGAIGTAACEGAWYTLWILYIMNHREMTTERGSNRQIPKCRCHHRVTHIIRDGGVHYRWVTGMSQHTGRAMGICPVPFVWPWWAARRGPGGTGWRPCWWTPCATWAGETARRSAAGARIPTGWNRPTLHPATVPSTSWRLSRQVRRRLCVRSRRPSPPTSWVGRTNGHRKLRKT